MRQLRAVLVAGALFAGCSNGATLPSSRAPLPAEPPSGPAPTASALESEIHDLVNRHRAARRLPALRWEAGIAAAARQHSGEMAAGRRGFGHDGFDERAAAIRRVMTVRSLAENVAYDSRTGAQLATYVVDGWIASAGHRQNIEGSFTHTGIGVVRGRDGVQYFTQIFALEN